MGYRNPPNGVSSYATRPLYNPYTMQPKGPERGAVMDHLVFGLESIATAVNLQNRPTRTLAYP
jgi:hypothetical protein